MCGIPDEHHSAHMPFFKLHPLHGRANDLIISLKRGQILLHWKAELPKAVAETLKASLQRIAALLDERKAQLWINHDKPQSATLRYAPAFYE